MKIKSGLKGALVVLFSLCGPLHASAQLMHFVERGTITGVGSAGSEPFQIIDTYDASNYTYSAANPGPTFGYTSIIDYDIPIISGIFQFGSVIDRVSNPGIYQLKLDEDYTDHFDDIYFSLPDIETDVLREMAAAYFSADESAVYGESISAGASTYIYSPSVIQSEPLFNPVITPSTVFPSSGISIYEDDPFLDYFSTLFYEPPWIGGGDGQIVLVDFFTLTGSSFQVDSAVPEASAWTYLLFGIGALGWNARRNVRLARRTSARPSRLGLPPDPRVLGAP